MANFMATIKIMGNDDLMETQQFESITSHKTKTLRKEKDTKQVMESFQLNTMATSLCILQHITWVRIK